MFSKPLFDEYQVLFNARDILANEAPRNDADEVACGEVDIAVETVESVETAKFDAELAAGLAQLDF